MRVPRLDPRLFEAVWMTSWMNLGRDLTRSQMSVDASARITEE